MSQACNPPLRKLQAVLTLRAFATHEHLDLAGAWGLSIGRLLIRWRCTILFQASMLLGIEQTSTHMQEGVGNRAVHGTEGYGQMATYLCSVAGRRADL